jgi:hypothetical protein
MKFVKLNAQNIKGIGCLLKYTIYLEDVLFASPKIIPTLLVPRKTQWQDWPRPPVPRFKPRGAGECDNTVWPTRDIPMQLKICNIPLEG